MSARLTKLEDQKPSCATSLYLPASLVTSVLGLLRYDGGAVGLLPTHPRSAERGGSGDQCSQEGEQQAVTLPGALPYLLSMFGVIHPEGVW